MAYNGKAIYNPSGKAGEYSYWACNFYNGCSNGCAYCYCKKGFLARTMGGNYPTLKKCFRDEEHAIKIFERDIEKNLYALRRQGLFFSFSTDPMLDDTMDLTLLAVEKCINNGIPVKILTKNADNPIFCFLGMLGELQHAGTKQRFFYIHRKKIAVGFTLTGHNELEKGTSTNKERITAMTKLHEAGYRTFASIEPVIDFTSSLSMIQQTLGVCDLYKIGLESGRRYPRKEISNFFYKIKEINGVKIYWKDSVLNALGFDRGTLKFFGFKNVVGRNYNMFNQP